MLTGEQKYKIEICIKNNEPLKDIIQNWDLTGVKIIGGNLDNIILSYKNISNSTFRFCSFKDAVLDHVMATGCDFCGCNFTKAILAYGNFSHSLFVKTNFFFSNAQYADFTFCELCDCQLNMGPKWSKGVKISKDYYEYLGRIWNIIADGYRVNREC